MGRSSTSSQDPPAPDTPAPENQPDHDPAPSSFQPTKSLFIERHYSFSRAIRIYDITDQAAQPPTAPTGDAYRAHACAVGQTAADTDAPATWTLSHPKRFGRTFRLLGGDRSAVRDYEALDAVPALACWRERVGRRRDVRIEFAVPDGEGGAVHCGHPVTVHSKSRARKWERFVVESAEFVWRFRPFREPRYVLERWGSGGRKVVVAQFWCSKWWVKHTGALAVDTAEVDEVVALSTWFAMVRKIMQRK
jgi:hypothetical protein